MMLLMILQSILEIYFPISAHVEDGEMNVAY